MRNALPRPVKIQRNGKVTLKEQRIRIRKEDGTQTLERCGLLCSLKKPKLEHWLKTLQAKSQRQWYRTERSVEQRKRRKANGFPQPLPERDEADALEQPILVGDCDKLEHRGKGSER